MKKQVAPASGTCPECGSTFQRRRREGGRIQVHCSVRCRMRASRKRRASNSPPCDWCGRVVVRFQSALAHAAKNHFCSSACKGKWMSENLRGPNHPRWKSETGIVQLVRRYLATNRHWQRWRDAVFANAGGLCERCGNPAEQAHHKREVAELLTLIIDPANGEALCSGCHRDHHHP